MSQVYKDDYILLPIYEKNQDVIIPNYDYYNLSNTLIFSLERRDDWSFLVEIASKENVCDERIKACVVLNSLIQVKISFVWGRRVNSSWVRKIKWLKQSISYSINIRNT